MFLSHPSSSWPGKLIKQFRGLCVLGAAETVGNDSRINGFTCCRRTPSHCFTVVTVLHEKVSCSESHTSACAACCSHLTPARRPNPALQGGQAAHPSGGFGAQRWAVVPGQMTLGIWGGKCGPTGSLDAPGDQGVSNGMKAFWQLNHPPHFQQ